MHSQYFIPLYGFISKWRKHYNTIKSPCNIALCSSKPDSSISISHADFSEPKLNSPLSHWPNLFAAWKIVHSPGHTQIIWTHWLVPWLVSRGNIIIYSLPLRAESVVCNRWSPRAFHFISKSPSYCPWKEVLAVLLLESIRLLLVIFQISPHLTWEICLLRMHFKAIKWEK